MSYKKFEQGDLLHNVIKAKPRFEFKIFKGNIFLNDSSNGYSLLNSFGEPAFAAPTPPTGACEQYAYDFSCLENSQYLPTI
jgi:hypothetical protein